MSQPLEEFFGEDLISSSEGMCSFTGKGMQKLIFASRGESIDRKGMDGKEYSLSKIKEFTTKEQMKDCAKGIIDIIYSNIEEFNHPPTQIFDEIIEEGEDDEKVIDICFDPYVRISVYEDGEVCAILVDKSYENFYFHDENFQEKILEIRKYLIENLTRIY